MISKLEFKENSVNYNRRIEPSDWRYSAAMVGMIRFFKDRNISYSTEGRYLYYNFEDIYNEGKDFEKDKDYLLFSEKWFSDKMHHNVVYKRLFQNQFTDEIIKEVNEKLSANTVMKKVFKGVKFDGTNGELIKELVDNNRLELISNTFCNSTSGYRKFINTSKYRSESADVCRLLGWC